MRNIADLFHDEMEAQKQRADVAEAALLRHGYRKDCTIPACNCGDQWNHGGNASERLSEIGELIRNDGRFNGKTIIQAVSELLENK